MPTPGPHAVKITVALLACVLATSHACPSSCVCKWKNGKETVECVGRNLKGIPNGINSDTQVLDVSGNSIKTLSKDRFESLGLVNLQRVYMSMCGMTHIDDRAFSGLKNLVELDLSSNNLTTIPSATFTDYTSLMRLIMNGNQIRHVKSRAFHALSSLTNLELSKCGIETVEEDAFLGLDKLEWLKLDGNLLTGIKGSYLFPKNLHGITLHDNPWQCDCGMIDLRTWLASYKNPFDISPMCADPLRLKGISLTLLEENSLACVPEVSASTFFLEIAEGKNTSLVCRIHAVPDARVSWWFQGNVLQNDTIVAPGVHLIYYIEEGTEDKKSELFIYNANTDDNGTFSCMAENPAGRAQVNYTIRIIVREEPVVRMSSFPTEYLIAVAAAVIIVILIACISIVACIVKCHRQKRKKRKEETGKVVALQSPQGKSSILVDANDRLTTMPTTGSKANGTVFISDRVGQNEMAYGDTHHNSDSKEVDAEREDPYFSPNSNRMYNLEQNPDLINDAESVGKERRLKGCDENNSYQEAMENTIDVQSQWHDVRYPVVIPTMNHFHPPPQPSQPTDVHLSAGRFLDSEGYPLDYGLPKLPQPHPGMSSHHAINLAPNMCRTLPHKSSRLHAAGQARRYSRDAEFPARQLASPYDHMIRPDVRHTVDGYPANPAAYPLPEPPDPSDPAFLPSPPSAYKTDPFPGACCATSSSPVPPPLRCSVGAQTTCEEMKPVEASASVIPAHHLSSQHGPLTESPDEGYEGEGAEAADI